jgi:hypothetical protein
MQSSSDKPSISRNGQVNEAHAVYEKCAEDLPPTFGGVIRHLGCASSFYGKLAVIAVSGGAKPPSNPAPK